MPLSRGKVPRDVLREILSVLSVWNVRDESLVLGPGEGLDAAVVRVDGTEIVMASDPITGAEKRIGFYAVHVNANDVAVLGARPRWMLVTVLLPEGCEAERAVAIEEDIARAARSLGVAVVGGHTEVTPGLGRPVVSGAMIGTVEKRLVLPGGARPGDMILMTKWAGLEGTAIIAGEREELQEELGEEVVRRALRFSDMISVVREALRAAELGARAMHDPTEGGLANGLHEMADAAGVGFRIWRDRIPIAEETVRICEFYDLDPLALLSSGALLIAAPGDAAARIMRGIERLGVSVSSIGEFTEAEEGRVLIADGEERELPRPESDEIWKVV
ncbi:MAG: hydrogenase [Thermococci archaeon]|nr:hydrogenase [Thermococci archaeon]